MMDRVVPPPRVRRNEPERPPSIEVAVPAPTHVRVPIIIRGYMRVPNTRQAAMRAEHGARVMIERVGSWLEVESVEAGEPE